MPTRCEPRTACRSSEKEAIGRSTNSVHRVSVVEQIARIEGHCVSADGDHASITQYPHGGVVGKRRPVQSVRPTFLVYVSHVSNVVGAEEDTFVIPELALQWNCIVSRRLFNIALTLPVRTMTMQFSWSGPCTVSHLCISSTVIE